MKGADGRRGEQKMPVAAGRAAAALLVSKRRAFVVAPAERLVAGQGFSAVDHKRRMLRFNNEPWLGAGFYVSGVAINRSAPGFPHTITPTLPRILDLVSDLGRQGLSQIMPYDLISLPPAARQELVEQLDQLGTVKFDMPVVEQVEALLAGALAGAALRPTCSCLAAVLTEIHLHSCMLL